MFKFESKTKINIFEFLFNEVKCFFEVFCLGFMIFMCISKTIVTLNILGVSFNYLTNKNNRD